MPFPVLSTIPPPAHPHVEPNAVVPLGNQLRQAVVKESGVRSNSPGNTEQVAAVKPDLERLLVIATTLDLACARARYSFGWFQSAPH